MAEQYMLLIYFEQFETYICPNDGIENAGGSVTFDSEEEVREFIKEKEIDGDYKIVKVIE